ncbi:MAG TPA: hypothetical protein VHG27_07185 [Xanthobacteraceae bacterium]|nr:hypothetical protein [Xanthobacteraceae bacterium]
MDLVQEFRKHAVECQRMARSAGDSDSKAVWNRMAERWHRCAELADGQASAAVSASARATRHRKSKYRWSDNHAGH